MSKFYITTAIHYVNDDPHIGHMYENVVADVIARHRRRMGDDVWFLTGADEHGQKIERAAAKEGILPIELADRVVAEPGLALAAPPSLALVCLRVETGDPPADDRATRALLAAVNATGRAFVSHTVVDGRYAIRVAVGGMGTERADVDALWELLRTTAADLRAAEIGTSAPTGEGGTLSESAGPG